MPKRACNFCKKCGLESMWLESSSAVKDLGIQVHKLKISQQCDFEVVKAEHILDCINRILSSKSRSDYSPLFSNHRTVPVVLFSLFEFLV